MHPLSIWGWNEWLEVTWNPTAPPERLARIIGVFGERCRIGLSGGAEGWAVLAGKARNSAEPESRPAVGDWALLRAGGAAGLSVIEALAPRRTWLARREPGTGGRKQLLAAHVDTAFLVTGLGEEFNLRRVERLLALVWEGGAKPVVLLNKIDIAADPEDLSSACGELRLASPGVPVIPVSARRGDGLAELARYLAPGLTIVLLGASGVGKSTLLNRLIEHKAQPVREVSGLGDRGRHTTTAREMFCLLSGALLVDTPGLREVGLLGDRQGLSRAFEDIAALAVSCRFRDCRHEHEPGCAVRGAAEAGSLDSVRYSAYLKLVREAAHAETEADALARQRRRLQEKSLAKRLRQRLKEKGYE